MLVRMYTTAMLLAIVAGPTGAQTVVDVIQATDGAWGLEYRDGTLWQGDDRDGFTYKISPVDGGILDVVATPYDQNTVEFGANHGVAYADTSLWVAGDFGKDWLFEISAIGVALDSIPSPTHAVGGLSWDGSLLLVSTYYPDRSAGILRIDPTDGSQIGPALPAPGEQPYGVAYNPADSTLWAAGDAHHGTSETIVQYAYPAGDVLSQFSSPAPSPKGMAFGDGYLWLLADNATGVGRRIYKIDLGGSGTPDITIDPTSYDFGTVPIGTPASYEQLILNDGIGDLTVTNIVTLPPFSVGAVPLPAAIPPGDTLRVDISFAPGSFGIFEQPLEISSDDVDESVLVVPLSGSGVPQEPLAILTPSSVSFSDTVPNLVRDSKLIVTNFGFEDLIVSELTVDDPAFSLVPNLPIPATLATFDTLVVQVIFAPIDLGAFAATMTISTNSPSVPVAEVAISATGVDKSFAGGEIIWKASGIENVVNTLAVPDITGDGIPDAIMESYDSGADAGNPHRAFYGNSHGMGVEKWSTGAGLSGGYGEQALALLGDVDDDGFDEVVRGVSWTGRRVELRSSQTGELIWQYDTIPFDGGGWIYGVAIQPDVTGDGIDEVLAAAGTDSGIGTGARRVVCLNGATGIPLWSLLGPDAFLSVAGGHDVNGDLIADAVAGAGGNGADTKVWCISGASIDTAVELWTFDTGGSVWSVSFIDDITGDGVADVVAGSWSNNVYGLNGATGSLLWTAPLGGGALRIEVVEDVNGDILPDIAVANLSATFRMLSGADGSTLWTLNTGSSTRSTAAIDDVSGDGINDVLVGSQNDFAYCLNGATGGVLWQTALGPLVHVVRPIADVNGSGFPDVLAGTQRLGSNGGELFCLEGGAAVVSVGNAPSIDSGIRFTGLSANPMPGRGAFLFDVSDAVGTTIEVSVFDASGRHVRSLLHRVQTGTSQLEWDGLDSTGRRVTSGNYFYRIRGLVRNGRVLDQMTGKLTIIH